MLTPQEVSTHSFSKASFGGYNMAMVDEFLDELTDDYTALYKENAALKAKLKVLGEKVEEYRATEDSMRATLLTAQRMADSIVKEAEQKRNLEKKVPLDWISPDGMQVTAAFEEYARPLILDEVTPVYVNGTPRHIRL